MSMLNQIGKEKRRLTEQLTRLDAEHAKLSDQLNELEIAQRAVRRFGDKAVATKKRSGVPAPKTARRLMHNAQHKVANNRSPYRSAMPL